MALIKSCNVNFKNQNQYIIYPANLCFENDKIYALMGHNGSGKSTLLKILARQLKPSSGKVCFNDEDIAKFPSKKLAQKIAYLPQHLPNLGYLSVKELVKMGRYSYEKLFFKDQDEGLIEEVMRLTNTLSLSNREIHTLSGGEKTRAFLAMLLAQKSEFLFLDEPLAALDIVYQFELMELISRLNKEFKVGIVLILHDINLAALYCDEIVALKEGRVIFNASKQEFMQEERLKDIFNIDASIIKHPKRKSPIALF
ncbi:ABC transporter ATP-binding protein [Campylobacter aviculae]|uniref:Fe3+-hydroxamate ABC transporter ATP-binding protein FhuC n=1 Tax=Campylobacter aviculae TaxID=2510190 RepID=A0A4U7BN12_9BACT|nr:ABC transporter ATP-binding protein [Campylobacter aviculae]TKX33149.1 Fe3+-hydroxamate ABC transporter ATP-binding protein FhuC [Campylobacter aviculae]